MEKGEHGREGLKGREGIVKVDGEGVGEGQGIGLCLDALASGAASLDEIVH